MHANEIEEAAVLLHAAHARGEQTESSTRSNRWERLVSAQRGLTRTTSLLSILAPEEIAAQGDEVRARSNELGKECEDTDYDYGEIQVDFSNACVEFIMLVRDQLGADAFD